MDTILTDLRYAVRKLLRTPGFTLVAVATLALAIGATTAVYSIVDGVLLAPLPFREPDQLVRLETVGRDGKPFPISPADYLDYRAQSSSFSAMAQFSPGSANLATNGGAPVRLNRLVVGPEFFSVLGIGPVRGRFFTEDEGTPGSSNVAVISENLWRSRFAADPGIIGQTLMLDERPTTVVGVAPATANYPQANDVFTPRVYQTSTDASARGAHQFFAVARVKRGITIERARDDMKAIAKRLADQYPLFDSAFGATVTPLREQIVGNQRPTLWAILGAVCFVLLIACANVANLLLVRASARSGEMAVRTALGASSRRIVRQLVTESLLLTVFGAVLGVLLALWIVTAIKGAGPSLLPRLDNVAINARVLGVTATIAVLTGVVFGIVPALYAVRPDIGAMLRESVRGSSRGGLNRLRGGLVVAELALAVVLLIGAGLLIKSFVSLLNVNLGFRTENVMTFDLPLPNAKYTTDQSKIAVATDVVSRFAALPGTQFVGVTGGRPLARTMMMTNFDVVGEPPKDPLHRTITEVHQASPSFFDAMGMQVLQGHAFGDAENRREGVQALVVNREFAKRYFPGQNILGKNIVLGVGYNVQRSPSDTNGVTGRIVGIVDDVKQRGLAQDAFPEVYVPYNALPNGFISVIVRTRAAPGTFASAVREQIAQIDPHLPIVGLSPMAKVVSDSVAQPRLYTLLLTAFAAIALLLAAIGIYGVVSYTVAQRSRELGIRIALGASRERVIALVLGEGATLATLGVGLGLLAAYGLTRAIRSLLFNVGALDVTTFGGVAASLVVVALLASWLPARRASRVDPLIAMRAE